MTRTKTLLLSVAILAVALLSAGCVGGLGGDDSTNDSPDATNGDAADTEAEELRLGAAETMENVETATFTMEMSTDTSQGSVEMSGEGVMDMDAREMRMEWNFEGAAGEQTVTQYVVDDTMYMKNMGQWYRQEMSQAVLWESNQLDQQADILDASSVKVTGTETYDGHTVTVLEVDPDQEEIQEIMAQGQSQVGEEFEMDEDTSVSDMKITQYVDEESQHVRHTEMRFDMEVSGESATVEMTMTFDEFGEPVDISLPEEAEDAGPLPGNGV